MNPPSGEERGRAEVGGSEEVRRLAYSDRVDEPDQLALWRSTSE